MSKKLIYLISLVLLLGVAGNASAGNTASNPSPTNGAEDVPLDVVLSWTPGDCATSHDVYFGVNVDDVENATTASPEFQGSQPLGNESYDPLPLVDCTTYYWRIDTVCELLPDDTHLLAHYEFEGNFNDSSGNNFHGTPVNGATIITDPERGQVANFVRDDDQYVDCGNPDALNFGTNDWTLSLWLKTTSDDKSALLSNGGDGGGGHRWSIGFENSPYDKATLTTDDNEDKEQVTGNNPINDGAWHHVVGVRKGGDIYIYVDGDGPQGDDDPGEDYDLSGTVQHNVLLGAIWNHDKGEDPYIEKYFTGLIDDVRVYDYALSHEEVLYLCGCGDIPVRETYKGDVWSFTTTCKVAVDIDIKPRSCPNPLNVNNKGVLPVAILGSEDLDVITIDVTSIRLAGVAPIRSSYEDVATPFEGELCDCHTLGPDGYTDLNLKFKTQDIVNALGEVADGQELLLTLTGNLLDGRPIEGKDCIIVLSKEGGGRSK